MKKTRHVNPLQQHEVENILHRTRTENGFRAAVSTEIDPPDGSPNETPHHEGMTGDSRPEGSLDADGSKGNRPEK